MEVFRILDKIVGDYSNVLIGIAILWKRKDLLSEGPKAQILWNRIFVALFGSMALQRICLAALASTNGSRFSNSIWAILFIFAVSASLRENSRSKKLLEVKDNLAS